MRRRRTSSAPGSTPSPTAPPCTVPTSVPPGVDVYTGGVPDQRLALTEADAQRAVEEYLRSVGAYASYPGLVAQVAVADGDTVRVELRAQLDLPLSFPGSPGGGTVAATGSAVSTVD